MKGTNKTHNHGSIQVTPGVMTPPATLKTDPNNVGDDTTGITINQSASAPATQAFLRVIDKDASTIVMEVFPTYAAVYNRSLGAAQGVFNTPASLKGTVSPICVELSTGARVWHGTGDPNSAFTGTGRLGDVYLRRDGGVGTYYYVCTTAGTPGTWTGIA